MEFLGWLQSVAGQVVVGVGYSGGSATAVTDGPNTVGYANWIIIRNRFVDPTSGGVGLQYFTGDAGTESVFYNTVAAMPVTTGGLLNLSRQVQISLRAIVRDMDNTTIVRSDNV